MAKGLLTNSWQQRLQQVNGFNTYTAEELTTTLTDLASHYDDLHALAIAFNLKEPIIASTVIGASSQQQLAQTLAAYEKINSITDFKLANERTKMRFIKNIDEKMANFYHFSSCTSNLL